MRVVLDTCILKLATFPAESNASALIFELTRAGIIEAWASPAILEEHADVLGEIDFACLTHDYFGVDLSLVWVVMERDLPSLQAAVDDLLANS